LRLGPRDVVLDVGCGTGQAFPVLEEAIGPEGRLIGIDLSAAMLARAAERIERDGWRNVTLIESSVEEALVPVTADGALLSFVCPT
jgi:demethylmenaquinone methyltransferase/2-methoxy-6-polyprenyl-1,4-benzoquinol methylase